MTGTTQLHERAKSLKKNIKNCPLPLERVEELLQLLLFYRR